MAEERPAGGRYASLEPFLEPVSELRRTGSLSVTALLISSLAWLFFATTND